MAARPRIIASMTASACFALLAVAGSLAPASEGHGTHTQLGMPPCGWAMSFDMPCATCGMTTSFAHAADGRLLDAFTTQPFGSLLAVLTAAVFWAGVYQAWTGTRVDGAFARLLKPKGLIFAGGLLLASWAYKIVTWS